ADAHQGLRRIDRLDDEVGSDEYLACRCKSVREGPKLALNLANEGEDLFAICRNRDQGTNVKEDGGSIDLEDRSRKHSDCLGRAKLLIIRGDNSYRVRIAAAGDLRRGLERNLRKRRINQRSAVDLDGH